MTKVDIFSGFLGAGKTTLIKKLIGEAFDSKKIVLIENEFGDIGIDGEFLKDYGIKINEMNSGCICCSLVGDFGKALEEVIEKFEPDRILIEPSGVAKLSDVIRAVEDLHDKRIVLNSFTTVVDAKKCKMYMKNFGEFFNNQLEYADTVILSHTAGMDRELIDEVIGAIRKKNSDADIITTDWDDIDGKAILDAIEKRSGLKAELNLLEKDIKEGYDHDHDHEHGCCGHDHDHDHECCGHNHDHDHGDECCGHNHDHGDESCGHDHDHEHGCCGHDHHADEVFNSLGFETGKSYDEKFLRDKLELIENEEEYGYVLRVKGLLPNKDGEWMHINYVPGEIDIKKGSPATTGMICVIGEGLAEDKLKMLFDLI